MLSDFISSYKKHLISREQLQLLKELGGLGVVNVRLKIKAQRVQFITRLLNIDTHVLKWKIINRREFQINAEYLPGSVNSEMAIFKTFVKNRLESEYHDAFE